NTAGRFQTTRRHGDTATRREITGLAINAQDDLCDLNDFIDFNDSPFTVHFSPFTLYRLPLTPRYIKPR
ncbi:MAG: hypothetical protein JSV47_03405, partial [Deltaproteobacteria bacterium]